jgi:uncharacterized Zn-finger protein
MTSIVPCPYCGNKHTLNGIDIKETRKAAITTDRPRNHKITCDDCGKSFAAIERRS